MSASKSGGTSTTIPTLSPEQNAMIAAQTGLVTSQIAPAYATEVSGATNLYNQTAPGVTNAAQNLAGTASQAQNVLGSTGQSALTSGVNALQNIASPAYQQAEMQAALQPAEAQYQSNLAGLNAGFGGAGEIGSSRQALAQQQLAGSTQAAQQQAAATVLNNIAQQQQNAGSTLSQLGISGLGGAQTAAQNQVTAALTPEQLYAMYGQQLMGVPSTSYNPNFAGTQSVTTTQQGNNVGINLSDIRVKENIDCVGEENGHTIYEFNYIGKPERYRGVMAQDVVTYKPEAIKFNKDGYMMVDYDMLGIKMTQVKE